MLNKFANLLKKLNRQRIIYDRVDNEPYLERYYLFLKDRTWFPFNVFLHKFLKSDPDVIHDHPWNYITIIVKEYSHPHLVYIFIIVLILLSQSNYP